MHVRAGASAARTHDRSSAVAGAQNRHASEWVSTSTAISTTPMIATATAPAVIAIGSLTRLAPVVPRPSATAMRRPTLAAPASAASRPPRACTSAVPLTAR